MLRPGNLLAYVDELRSSTLSASKRGCGLQQNSYSVANMSCSEQLADLEHHVSSPKSGAAATNVDQTVRPQPDVPSAAPSTLPFGHADVMTRSANSRTPTPLV